VVTLYGIDIAKYQSGLDLHAIRAEGFSWCEARASTGYQKESIDPSFAGFKKDAHSAGLLFVAYHFLYSSKVVPIGKQVDTCVKAIGDESVPVMIDHETADNTGTPSIADALLFAKGMRSNGFYVPLWYLPHWVWASKALGSPTLPSGTGLSLVASAYVPGKNYASTLYPGPRNWPPEARTYGGMTPVIWQFTDQALVAGKYIDADATELTKAQLTDLLTKPTAKPNPEPTLGPYTSAGNVLASPDGHWAWEMHNDGVARVWHDGKVVKRYES
jgi:hypothetical protein